MNAPALSSLVLVVAVLASTFARAEETPPVPPPDAAPLPDAPTTMPAEASTVQPTDAPATQPTGAPLPAPAPREIGETPSAPAQTADAPFASASADRGGPPVIGYVAAGAAAAGLVTALAAGGLAVAQLASDKPVLDVDGFNGDDAALRYGETAAYGGAVALLGGLVAVDAFFVAE